MIRRVLLLTVGLLFLTAAVFADSLRIHFIDVGQGDAILLEAPDAAVLVDAGQYDDAVDYLRAAAVERIDLAIATHAHADHVGGFPPIFESIEVAEVWYNGQEHTTLTFERFLDAVLDSGAAYHEPIRGERVEYGDLAIEVLHPTESAADYDGDLHDMNIIVRVSYGEFAVMLTGDAESDVERELVETGNLTLTSTVLKLGHHGSNTSSTREFLEAVAFEIAVYQAGEDNRYGHPHDEVLWRLDEYTAAEVYGNDVHGTIVIETDGVDYSVRVKSDGSLDTPAAACIDLNTANADQLTELIHIGEGRAEAIIDMRPIESKSELIRIHGIGDARLEDIRDQGVVCPIE